MPQRVDKISTEISASPVRKRQDQVERSTTMLRSRRWKKRETRGLAKAVLINLPTILAEPISESRSPREISNCFVSLASSATPSGYSREPASSRNFLLRPISVPGKKFQLKNERGHNNVCFVYTRAHGSFVLRDRALFFTLSPPASVPYSARSCAGRNFLKLPVFSQFSVKFLLTNCCHQFRGRRDVIPTARTFNFSNFLRIGPVKVRYY